MPGGPNVNHRLQLIAGRIEFYMSANTLQAFDAVAQNIPTLVVAAIFQKDPQVLLAHPDQGIEKFEDLKKLTLLDLQGGRRVVLPMDEARLRLPRAAGEALHLQPAAVPRRQAHRDAGLCDVGALCDRDAGRLQAEDLPARRPGLGQLFDPDRDAPRSGGEEARSGAALRRCLGDRLGQLSLRRQCRGERAHQARQSGNDRRADRLFDRQDEGIRHRQFRRHASRAASAP